MSTIIAVVSAFVSIAAALVCIITRGLISTMLKGYENDMDKIKNIDEVDIKRNVIGPTPETVNLIKSCQIHDDNYVRPMISESVSTPVSTPLQPTVIAVQQPSATTPIIPTMQAMQTATQTATQQQAAQSTKAPVVKARTIQEQRQIITNFLKLKEDTLKPDKVLVRELGTTIGTLEKYATTEQMTEWARLRQVCFSKPRFTQSSTMAVRDNNNVPTSLEQNNNKRIMEA